MPEKKGRARRWARKLTARARMRANRRRAAGERGKRLLRQRGELIERSFAHAYETGGMRRMHLRGHPNILEIHLGAFNLGLLMRQRLGLAKPRRLQGERAPGDHLSTSAAAFFALLGVLLARYAEAALFTAPEALDAA